jgi:hypothetical protein
MVGEAIELLSQSTTATNAECKVIRVLCAKRLHYALIGLLYFYANITYYISVRRPVSNSRIAKDNFTGMDVSLSLGSGRVSLPNVRL